MQFALQDLRRWGNKKIFNNYFKSSYIERIRVVNIINSVTKSSAYSLPKYWANIKPKIESWNFGMTSFIYMCEPMMDNIDITKSIQRKVRNQWDSIWNGIAKDLNLSEDTKNTLKEFGIKICFNSESNSVMPDICNFYSSIILWNIFISSGSSLDSTGVSAIDLVEKLIVYDADCFINYIRNNFRN